MSYEELYKLFTEQNRHLSKDIIDYRPAGKNRLEIWLKDNIAIYATYNQEIDKFDTENIGPDDEAI